MRQVTAKEMMQGFVAQRSCVTQISNKSADGPDAAPNFTPPELAMRGSSEAPQIHLKFGQVQNAFNLLAFVKTMRAPMAAPETKNTAHQLDQPEMILAADYKFFEPDGIGMALVREASGNDIVCINGFSVQLRPSTTENGLLTMKANNVAQLTLGLRKQGAVQLHQTLGQLLQELEWLPQSSEDQEK